MSKSVTDLYGNFRRFSLRESLDAAFVCGIQTALYSYRAALGNALPAAASRPASSGSNGNLRDQFRGFFCSALPRPVLVIRVLFHVKDAESLRFLHVRLLLAVGKDSPQFPQPPTDFRVVHIWKLHRHFPPLQLRPDHERVHGTLYVILLLLHPRLSADLLHAVARHYDSFRRRFGRTAVGGAHTAALFHCSHFMPAKHSDFRRKTAEGTVKSLLYGAAVTGTCGYNIPNLIVAQ